MQKQKFFYLSQKHIPRETEHISHHRPLALFLVFVMLCQQVGILGNIALASSGVKEKSYIYIQNNPVIDDSWLGTPIKKNTISPKTESVVYNSASNNADWIVFSKGKQSPKQKEIPEFNSAPNIQPTPTPQYTGYLPAVTPNGTPFTQLTGGSSALVNNGIIPSAIMVNGSATIYGTLNFVPANTEAVKLLGQDQSGSVSNVQLGNGISLTGGILSVDLNNIGTGGIQASNISGLTEGQLLFGQSGGSIGQSPQLYWDNVRNSLGIGANPIAEFTLSGSFLAGNAVSHPNVGNVYSKNVTSGMLANRPMMLIDSSAYMKIVRNHDQNGAGVELQQWTSGLTGAISYWDFYAEAGGFGVRDRITPSGANRLYINQFGNVLIGSQSGSASKSNTESLLYGTGNMLQVAGNSYFGGKVGIGTTNPDHTLSISGSLAYRNGSQGTGKVLTTDASGVAEWGYVGIGSLTGFLNGQIPFGNSSGGLSQMSDLFWDQNNKRFGVGTNTPSALFTVRSNIPTNDNHIIASFQRNSTQSFNFIQGVSGNQFVGYSAANNAKPLTFNTTTDELNSPVTAGALGVNFQIMGTNRMVISGSGNVGIGTSNPLYPLDVNGIIRSNNEIISSNANGFRIARGDFGLVLRNDGLNSYFLLTNSGSAYGGWNGLRPFSIANTTGDVFLGNNSLYVRHGGHVGIGTVNPTQKLDVVGGNIRTTDDIHMRGTNGNGFVFHSRPFNDYDYFKLAPSYSGAIDWGRGITLMRNTGYVGIGGYDASAPLHVRSAATGTVADVIFENNNRWVRFIQTQGQHWNPAVGGGQGIIFSNDGTNATASGVFSIAPWSQIAGGLHLMENGNVGIATSNAQSKFEINSGTGGLSGLRFTQLNNTSTALSGNGKVLSLNELGEVILTDSSGSFSIGSIGNGLSISGSTLSLGLASTTTTGALSAIDWNTFNNKINLTSLSATGGITYNSTTGVFGWGGTTDQVTEGISNLYYTTARFVADFTSRFQTAFDTAFGGKTTDNLTEGASNLYYTDARVQNTMSGVTASISGAIANTNSNLVTLSGVVANKISLTSLSATGGITYNSTTGVFSDILTVGAGLTRTANEFRIGTLTGGLLSGFTLGQLTFGTATGGLTQSSNLFWDNANGRLGIGTTTPLYKVHIQGTGSQMLAIQSTDANDAILRLSAPGKIWAFNLDGNGNSSATGSFNFIEDGGLSRLTIAPGGNIGIGTSTPTARLDIAGNIRIADGTQGIGKLLLSDASGLATWSSLTGGMLSGLTAGQLTFGTASGGLTQSSNLFWDNTNGRLGIGTATPSQLLHIQRNSADWSTSRISNTVSSLDFGVSGLGDAQINQNGNYNLIFGVNGAERMRIRSNGDIGIGTTAPTARLEVNSTQTGASGLKFTQLNSTMTGVASNGKVLALDSSGNVILANDAGAAGLEVAAQRTNAFSLTTTLQSFAFNSEITDINNRHDITTGIYTAPTSDMYEISASAQFTFPTSGAGTACLVIRRAGTQIVEGCNGDSNDTGGAAFNANVNVSAVISLTAGQTVDIAAYRKSGSVTTFITTANTNYLTIKRVGSAPLVTSDSRLKKNITSFTGGLDDILGLNTVSFEYNGMSKNAVNDGVKHVGIIAQEVQSGSLGKYAISTGPDGYLRYDPNSVLYSLVNSVKALETKKANSGALAELAQSLSGQLVQLSERINALSFYSGSTTVVNNNYYTQGSSTNTGTTETISSNASSWLDTAFSFVSSLIVRVEATFSEMVTFMKSVVFRSTVIFEDRVTFADKDMAGTATIHTGSNSVRVDFAHAYTHVPIVTVTADAFVTYRVTDKGITGFTIQTQENVSSDTRFDWIALSTGRSVSATVSTSEPPMTTAEVETIEISPTEIQETTIEVSTTSDESSINSGNTESSEVPETTEATETSETTETIEIETPATEIPELLEATPIDGVIPETTETAIPQENQTPTETPQE